ncbi:hypothetical protein GH714_036548 [Hevea brasiliensis]|uniref:Reverse transcriptase RNase H-like domain-containing protein n=1 Tax=Hevea brasiliensis TaxID=3981 RepID=A0A6A6M6L8_HEVBR|nr:hypothetical protein GH714_036548 [Hevea brasiliensis]
MGGLKSEIADGIRMFKPKYLKEAISLARMRDEQLNRQRPLSRPGNRFTTESSFPTKFKPASPMKLLTWDEMQKRRAQGLCFNCDEKFAPGHRCKGPQLLVLECGDEGSDTEEQNHSMARQPEISFHALTGWTAQKNHASTSKDCLTGGSGIGAVLTQQGKPIALMSRALGINKQSWSVYAKEMLAIIHAIQTWRPYLLGCNFYIHTDQRSLKHLMEQRIELQNSSDGCRNCWVMITRTGTSPERKTMLQTLCYALSRVAGSPSLDALFVSQTEIREAIKAKASHNSYMQKIAKQADDNPGSPYGRHSGLLCYKNRVVVATPFHCH